MNGSNFGCSNCAFSSHPQNDFYIYKYPMFPNFFVSYSFLLVFSELQNFHMGTCVSDLVFVDCKVSSSALVQWLKTYLFVLFCGDSTSAFSSEPFWISLFCMHSWHKTVESWTKIVTTSFTTGNLAKHFLTVLSMTSQNAKPGKILVRDLFFTVKRSNRTLRTHGHFVGTPSSLDCHTSCSSDEDMVLSTCL